MFKPKIVGFICNWSLPSEATVLRSRIPSYPKIHIIRVMCLGGIDPVVVLETFAKRADGVLLVGCHPSECHYVEGNFQAELKTKMLKRLISRTGIEPERLQIDYAHPSEIERFAKIIDGFRDHIAALGSSPLTIEKTSAETIVGIMAAKAVAESFRLRTLVGREKELIEKGTVYGEKMEQDKLDKVLDECIDAEYTRCRIQIQLKNNPMSVKGLAKHFDLNPRDVLRHIVVLRHRGSVELDRIEGAQPLYVAREISL